MRQVAIFTSMIQIICEFLQNQYLNNHKDNLATVMNDLRDMHKCSLELISASFSWSDWQMSIQFEKIKRKLNLKFVIKYQRQVFHITLYYLNFNRIDMKKELRSRIKNSNHHSKPEFQTKPSDKKQRRKTVKLLGMLKQGSQTMANSHTEEPNTQPILKADVQSCETSTDIPSNINLDHYIDDINNHIIEIDKSFHDRLGRELKIAANIQITSEMRKILIKWLIKVARKFRVRSETMHICVQLIDYMLIYKGLTFNKTNFQLLGVTCLFISCKYNEIYTIESEKYVQLCDGIYSVQQLFQMESFVLLELNFNLQVPTIYQFINKIVSDLKIAGEHQGLIKSLADLFIFDFNSFNNYKKYELSTVIVYFASKVYKLEDLKSSLSSYKNKIQPQVFKECFLAVMALFKKSHLNNSNISI